ncbi:TlpA family protein disulfide reductase [bacterium]|nr:TlpA family protein disulfide reductase [bacterium]
MVRALLLLVCLGLLPIAANAAGERVDIVRGFLEEVPSSQPHRIDVGETRYMIQAAGTPVDRRQVYEAGILYVDQFPDTAELFRDDMDAFDRMVKKGGVLILLCGADANAMTLENMNYLGKRFGYRFAENTTPGEILPARVGQGPMGGDVWLCESGYRILTQTDSEWAWHYMGVDGTRPVAVSRHWGEGFILLMGTTEVNRTSGGRVFSALSLIDWARKAKILPPPPPTETPTPIPTPEPTPEATPDATPVSPIEAAMERLSGTEGPTAAATATDVPTPDPTDAPPQSNLLAERLKEMRARLGVQDPNAEDSGPLIAEDKRAYFPPIVNGRDLDGRIVDLTDYRGKVLLIDYWATWSDKSVESIPERVALRNAFRAEGFDLLGISLDKSIPSIRAKEKEFGMDWRQICDGQGWNSRHVRIVDVGRVPHSYLLDKKGRICAENLRGNELRAAVRQALAEK